MFMLRRSYVGKIFPIPTSLFRVPCCSQVWGKVDGTSVGVFNQNSIDVKYAYDTVGPLATPAAISRPCFTSAPSFPNHPSKSARTAVGRGVTDAAAAAVRVQFITQRDVEDSTHLAAVVSDPLIKRRTLNILHHELCSEDSPGRQRIWFQYPHCCV
jgi:hypothetical protein